MHMSDFLLDSLRERSRLAAKCGDDRTAADLQVLSLRLLLAAMGDPELMADEPPQSATA